MDNYDKMILTSIKTKCLNHGFTICGAESITGGGISYALSSIADASRFFHGSVITYSVKAKENILKIDPVFFELHSVYSQETALAMAIGAQKIFGSTLSFGITGLAGPGRDGSDLPIGSVFIAAVMNNKQSKIPPLEISKGMVFSGDRAEIRHGAVVETLKLLEKMLSNATCFDAMLT